MNMFKEALGELVEQIDSMTGEEVYAWLTSIGVEFEPIIDSYSFYAIDKGENVVHDRYSYDMSNENLMATNNKTIIVAAA